MIISRKTQPFFIYLKDTGIILYVFKWGVKRNEYNILIVELMSYVDLSIVIISLNPGVLIIQRVIENQDVGN